MTTPALKLLRWIACLGSKRGAAGFLSGLRSRPAALIFGTYRPGSRGIVQRLLAKEVRISLRAFASAVRLARFAFREFQDVRSTMGLFRATTTPPFFTENEAYQRA
jgi:hypothetical protein